MNDKMMQGIMTQIDALSQKLGVASQYIWAVTVRQQFINGIESSIGAFIFSVIFGFCVYLIAKWLRSNERERDNSLGIAILSLIFGVITLIILIFSLINAIDCLANPGFQAFQSIVYTLQGNGN